MSLFPDAGDAVRRMAVELAELEEGLSAWEVGFVDEVAKAVDRGDPLTRRQADKVREIWNARIGDA
jgi:hypothetical protein